MNKILLLLLFFSFTSYADMADYKNTCEEIGFKPKTEDFGSCVLKLKKKRDFKSVRERTIRDAKAVVERENINSTNKINQQAAQQQAEAQANAYFSQIKSQYSSAQQQYQKQLLHQQKQIAALQKAQADAKRRKASMYLMKLGEGIAQGKTIGDSARAAQGLPLVDAPTPIEPKIWWNETYTININDASYRCTYNQHMNKATCYD
ncbi:hypothetical protein OAJ43_00510 [Nitrosomonadales bacterium]|nr:hypothetical protein [Nitrosomonadales bacterium]